MATLKQKKAIKIIEENPGIAVSKAMEQAGYSKITAKTPQNLTDSAAFQELFSQAISDDDLIEAHRAGLNAHTKRPQMIDRDDKGRPIYDYVEEPDFHARHKYLDTAYKLRGRYTDTPEGVRPMTVNIINFYGTDSNNNTPPVHTEGVSTTIPESV